MNVKFTLNDLQRQRVEDHLALVEQVLRRSIKTNETVDGMGHDDLYQEGCIALCRASVSYREEMGAFPAYARTVIRIICWIAAGRSNPREKICRWYLWTHLPRWGAGAGQPFSYGGSDL